MVGVVVGIVAAGLVLQLTVVTPWTTRLAWRWIPAAVGWAIILLALDWGLGAAWDAVTGVEEASSTLDLATVELPPASDPRADSPAYEGEAWADRYFAELEAIDYAYVPYLGVRPGRVEGRYINTADGRRRSYEPPGSGTDEALEVWFFGGSTLWGEGQRDLHTIPSEVARMAEADGITIRAVNYGERGYTAFQEFLLFEQELAMRPAPDLAVFYHGINEVFTQLEDPDNLGPQPSHYQIDVYRHAFARAPALPGQDRSPTEPSLWREYRDNSVIAGLLDQLGELAAVPPAGAGQGEVYQPEPEEIDRAIDYATDIYQRSIRLIRHVAERASVPAAIFWQPHNLARDSTYGTITARVGDEGYDISNAFTGAPSTMFIDLAHTNELGARIAAAAVWEHLVDDVETVLAARD